MIKRKIIFIFFVFIFVGNSAVAQKKKKNKKKKADSELMENIGKLKNAVSDRDKEFALDVFTQGMKFFILQDYEQAVEKFTKAYEYDEQNATIQYQLAYTYLKLAKFDKALPFAQKAVELEKGNEYFYEVLAEIYKYNHQYEEAIEVYQTRLDNIKPNAEAFYFDLAGVQLLNGDYKSAIATYNKAEEKFGLNEEVIKQKQRIYLRKNEVDMALKEGQKLVDAFPFDTNYLLDQAQLLMSASKSDEAIVLLDKILEENSDESRAKFLLSDVYKLKGDKEKSFSIMKEAFSSPDLDLSLKLDIAYRYLQRANVKSEWENGLELSKLILENHSQTAKANALYADFLVAKSEAKEADKQIARKHYSVATQLDGSMFNYWRQLIGLDWELNQMDSVVRHTEDALEYFPNQIILQLQNGAAQSALGNYEEAEAILSQAKMMSGDNKEFKVQIQSYLGDIYHNLKEYKKSDEAFEEVLAYNENDLHALNNYSYFLSLRKENLEKAKEMGKKLVTLEPENDTYLDTYGWVLYVNGDLKEAKIYLGKAAQNTSNATVVEHYGDVLFRLGEKEAAMEQWKKAEQLGGSDDPEKLAEKLKEGKLIE